jgi:hypothetical protein
VNILLFPYQTSIPHQSSTCEEEDENPEVLDILEKANPVL